MGSLVSLRARKWVRSSRLMGITIEDDRVMALNFSAAVNFRRFDSTVKA
jgi:hypothetical protein